MIIALTLFRRPSLTRQMLAALARCFGIAEARLLLSCDWAPEHGQACDEVIALAEGFDACETVVSVHRPRLGIDLNCIFVLGKAFEQSEFAIMLQDDCIPSPDALCYFEQMGERFREDARVVTVSGYNRTNVPAANIEPYKIGFKPTFVPWGFGIWKDRFERLLAGGGARYRAETGDQCNTLLDWWMCRQLKPGQGMVYPELSRINLVGFDNAEHPHSREYHERFEANSHCWAGNLNFSEPTPELWEL